jgi:hypothetical protein
LYYSKMKPFAALVLGLGVGITVTWIGLSHRQSNERAHLDAEISGLKERMVHQPGSPISPSEPSASAAQGDQKNKGDPRVERANTSHAETLPPKFPETASAPVHPANASILNYLGDPCPPPPSLDARYTAEGLATAFKDLCAARGVRIEKLGIDTAEFPFALYGVVERSSGGDFFRDLKEELKAMPGYTYGGSVTGRSGDGSTYFALNMTPNSVIPREQSEAIQRRLMIRLQMLGAAWQPVR